MGDIRNKLKDIFSIISPTYRTAIRVEKKLNTLLRLNRTNNLTIRPLPVFQVSLADHCNLNCAYCLHFSPLSDEKFLDIKEYEADIKRLSFLFGGVAQEIRLMGGEPLLNPHIADFIRITREHFPVGAISIVTNALLLSKMPEDFWQAAKECKAIIRPSFYPIKGMDYSEGEALAKAHGVE